MHLSDAVKHKFSGKICNGKEKPATSITSSISSKCLPTFSAIISGGGRKDRVHKLNHEPNVYTNIQSFPYRPTLVPSDSSSTFTLSAALWSMLKGSDKITGRENLVRSLPKSCQIKAPTFTFSSSGRKWGRQALDGLLPRRTVKAREPLNDGYRY